MTLGPARHGIGVADGGWSTNGSSSSSGQTSQDRWTPTSDLDEEDDFIDDEDDGGVLAQAETLRSHATIGAAGDVEPHASEAFEMQESVAHSQVTMAAVKTGGAGTGTVVAAGATSTTRYMHDGYHDGTADHSSDDGASDEDSSTLYTVEEEEAVVRKLDRKLVLFVALLYMLSFLDRSNIGNAHIAGMDEDLQSIPANEKYYVWALVAFYVAYIAFEWMSLLWKVIPAHMYISALVLSWGVIASLQAVSVSYPMLICLRALLGVGEAGFTGIPFYLSFFFKRHELAFRTAIFISAAPLATSFASSLAWLILDFGSYMPIAPWRVLFLVEGFPAVFVSVVAWHVIPDSPRTARYLTAREREVACLRLAEESPVTSTSTEPTGDGIDGRDAASTFLDPAAWLLAVMFMLTNMAYSSLPVFLPVVLEAMGHDALGSQALAAPPYLVAFIMVLATAHASDAARSRAPFVIFHALLSFSGYAVLALSETLGLARGSTWRYVAVYPAAVGFFSVVVLVIAWSINNQRSSSRRGAGFALLQVVGQCGPLIGTTSLYPDADTPFYTRGMAVCAGAMLGVAVLAVALRAVLRSRNDRLDAEYGEQGDENERLVGSGLAKSGQAFRYML